MQLFPFLIFAGGGWRPLHMLCVSIAEKMRIAGGGGGGDRKVAKISIINPERGGGYT